MLLYLIQLITITLIAVFIEPEKNNFKNVALKVIVFLILWIVSAFRYEVGTDYNLYKNYFIMSNSYYPDENVMELGYFYFNKFLYLFSGNEQIIFIVTSFITIFLILKFIFQYSKNLPLSLFLFVTLYFYYWTFNGLRQWMVIAICLNTFKYIENRNLLKFLTIIILASFIHNSCLIMIPIYFVINKKFSIKFYSLFLGVSFIFYILFTKLISYISIIPLKYAQKYLNTDYLSSDSNILYFLLPCLIFIIAIIFKNKLEYIDKRNIIYINMIFFSLPFLLLGLKSYLFSRFADYFKIYLILLIPYIPKVFSIKLRPLISLLIIYTFLIHWSLILYQNNSDILPYNSYILGWNFPSLFGGN